MRGRSPSRDTGQKWSRDGIARHLRDLYRNGADLSYCAMARVNQPLVSASNYHFGSYRRAVMMAGLDYRLFIRKPCWNEAWIVRLIKTAHRAGEDLSWRAVSSRRDPMGRAASAAVHPHLFGNWNAALLAAGLDPEKISRYRKWDRKSMITEFRTRHQKGNLVNSGSIQEHVPGLYRAAVREFGTFDGAIKAAGLNPDTVRQRRAWTKEAAIKEMVKFERQHGSLSSTVLRRYDSGLERMVVQYFKSLPAARRAIGMNGSSKHPAADGRKAAPAKKRKKALAS